MSTTPFPSLFSTIWVSVGGLEWEKVDIGFRQIQGDKIEVGIDNELESIPVNT